MAKRHAIYGLMAEFDTPTDIVAAARESYEEGYRKMDAYTPFPIEELSESLHLGRSKLPLIVLIGGIVGCLSGFLLQWWTATIDYPVNIGGRPLFSWPMFIPVTFETTILFAAFSAVFGMLALNGLPEPYHPVFNSHRFELASRSHFFLCIEATDPKFDIEKTTEFLKGIGAKEVAVVES